MSVRSAWWTLMRSSLLAYPHALAAHDGTCPSCERAVRSGEVITFVGGLSRDPDGRIAEHPHPEGEWVCDACYPRPLEEVRGPGTRAT